LERPRWRSTLTHRIVPALQVGVEINPAADEIGPLFTWFLLTERGPRPALFLGTSSDRIGSPAGEQAYFLTVAKNVDPIPVSLYASLNYSEWDQGLNVPFGANVEVVPAVTVQPMYDGERTHLLLTYSAEHFSFSLMHVWLEDFGVAASVGF